MPVKAVAVARFSPNIIFLLFMSGYCKRKCLGKKILLEISAAYVLGRSYN